MEGSSARQDNTHLKALLHGSAAARLRRLLRNRIFLFGIGPAILLVVALVYLALNAGVISTDDATVAAARVAIAPSVRGRIVSVAVHDNQRVRAGDILVRLDPGDYQTAVADAEARLAAARLQVASLRAQYDQAAAQVGAARVTSAYAQRELTRQRNLFRAGVTSRRDVDEAAHQAELAARQNSVAVEAQASALANLGGGVRLAPDRHPLVLQAQAALDQARSDAADTVIRAPRDGIVARVDQVQIGAYAQPAQALFWLISGNPWVDAAFKEDQLEHLQPGQPVLIHIDAYPHHQFQGHVASLSPGTGSSFSVLPTQNASGNWVKVVQRLTVRIVFDELPDNAALAVGLSASVRIDTKRAVVATTAPALRGREE